MPFELHNKPFPGIAASPILAGQPLKFGSGGERQVVPITNDTDEIDGLAMTAALTGQAVAVHMPGDVIKAKAVASIGGGAKASWVNASAGYTAGASGKQASGKNVSGQAVPGDVISLYIRPGGITA